MDAVDSISNTKNEVNEDTNRRSEGEIDSNSNSPDELNKKNGENSDSLDKRKRKRKESRFSSRSRCETRDKEMKDGKHQHRRSPYSSKSRSLFRHRSRSHSLSRHRSRSRSLSRHRSRSRSLSRHRSRSQSHSRSRRSRSGSRSRYRSKSKYRRRCGSGGSYDVHVSNDSDSNSECWKRKTDKYQASYKYQEPNDTVMVRELPPHVTALQIREDALKCGIGVKDVRLILNRHTGLSRGFAFVEFNTVKDASRWMNLRKGLLILEDKSEGRLVYSALKTAQDSRNTDPLDWHCSNCQRINFKRREICYKCNATRQDNEPEQSEEISSYPTTTIILSGLDVLTTEEKVLQFFESKPYVATLPIKNVRISRDISTNLSRGICYIDTNNLMEAMRLHQALSEDVITIDQRCISIAYHKPTVSRSSRQTIAATAVAAAQWTNNTSSASSTLDELESQAKYSASVYAKSPGEYASYLEYYRKYYRNKSSEVKTRANSASADGNSKMAVSGAQVSGTWTDKAQPTPLKDFPNSSRFQYDASSGYYYDHFSQFYYDQNTQHFYDLEKKQYLYWNSEAGRYSPVKGKSTRVNANGKEEKNKEKVRKPENQAQVETATTLVKKMEKWAKSLKETKEFSKLPTTADNYRREPQKAQSSGGSFSKSQNFPVSNLTKTVTETESFNKVPHTAFKNTIKSENEKSSGLINYIQQRDCNFVDYIRMLCLLCKRQFPNVDTLDRHLELSDLHKKNMSEFVKESSISTSDNFAEPSTQYRNRAQERRTKFSYGQQAVTNSLKDIYITQPKESTSTGSFKR